MVTIRQSRAEAATRAVRDVRRRMQELKHSSVPKQLTASTLQSLGFEGGYTAQEFDDLLTSFREMAFSASHASNFAVAYLASECLSKWAAKGLVGTSDEQRKSAALNKFWECEAQCFEANQRLVDWESRASLANQVEHIRRARGIIAGILGGSFPWEEYPRACGFGPGASTCLKRVNSSQQNKWQNSRHITARCLPYLMAFQKWAALPDASWEVEIVEGNHVTTVPKSWKTDRVIAIEPCWNSFFQKGVGKLIRRRLQRIGLLQKDAKEYHMHLAKTGSTDGYLATLDLSSASDTVSYGLVEALLPPAWLSVLADVRSDTMGEGEASYRYQKWSSMGNGYTFELETLIFYSLCAAVCSKDERGRVSVFGDDMIVPSHRVPAIVELLTSVGLTLNTKKSFWGSHPFRESCGGHYFRGEDVTPFYLRQPVATVGDMVVLLNHLRTWGRRHGVPEFGSIWSRYARTIPQRLRGPEGVSGTLWCEWDFARPDYDPDLQAFLVLTVTRQHLWNDVWTWSGSYLFKLWEGMGDEYDALETSYLSRATSKEVVGTVVVDRGHWGTC